MYRDILLPVDLEHDSSWRKALPTALELVKAFDARLHVIAVVPDFGYSMVGAFFPKDFEKRALEKANEALHEFVKHRIPEDVPVQHIIGHGAAYEEILRFAERTGCDLIVMGSHRPEREDYLIGANASRVVHHSKCSVMIVRE